MNQARRNMVAALQASSLPVEAMAFIKEGSPKPQTQAAILTTPAPAKQLEPITVTSVTTVPTPVVPRSPKQKAPEAVTLVPMNFRMPSEIPAALLKASAERKMTKTRPYTQQDIIAEALTAWLKENSYLS